jgi:hypothetical protein
MMIDLPNVTLVCIDTVNYGPAINAINKSLEKIKPAKTIFFTDIACVANDDFDVINIKHLYSKKDYSKFMMKELGKHIQTDFMLVIQWDGYVLDENAWDDEFLKYDYIGAPWIYGDGKNVGNGGFSLRSTYLHKVLAEDHFIVPMSLEDDAICRTYREYLENVYRIKFAPEELAHKFSFELNRPRQETFGFHSFFHQPFKEHIVIKRTGALGDVIQTEPILEYFHKQGHPVVLQTTPSFYNVFAMHHYPVISYERFDKSVRHRVINLDMGYEWKPRQLHLKSYFEVAGITDYKLRNPKLTYKLSKETRLFKQKYVVIHIDKRETSHRNQFEIDWDTVRSYLESRGYLVIQVGKNEHDKAGIEFNCFTETMLMWVIAGADLMIAVDSGPSHVAVALGIKSVILFGSVSPWYIHPDMTGITPLFSDCPIKKQFCWHEKVGTTGSVCEVDAEIPPCCVYDTQELITRIAHKL